MSRGYHCSEVRVRLYVLPILSLMLLFTQAPPVLSSEPRLPSIRDLTVATLDRLDVGIAMSTSSPLL